jgi:hypothetical protein
MEQSSLGELHPAIKMAALLFCGVFLFVALPPVVSDAAHAPDVSKQRLVLATVGILGTLGTLYSARRWRVALFVLAALELLGFALMTVVIESSFYRPW